MKGPLVEVYPNLVPIRQTTQVSNARPPALETGGLPLSCSSLPILKQNLPFDKFLRGIATFIETTCRHPPITVK